MLLNIFDVRKRLTDKQLILGYSNGMAQNDGSQERI